MPPIPDSNYPGAIDDYTSLMAAEVQALLTDKSLHMRKALGGVSAIEQALGVNPQGAAADVAARIAALENPAPVSFVDDTFLTTDDTPFDLFRFTPDLDTVYGIDVLISVIRTGGAGNPGDCMFIKRSGIFGNVNGVAYLNLTTVGLVSPDMSPPAQSITYQVSGTDIQFLAVGQGGENSTWRINAVITKLK
jgi:hypothetical protein